MARTLNATLLAAQSSQSRHPLCGLTISRAVADIPFVENPGFSPDSHVQYNPSAVELSDGRLAAFYTGYSPYGVNSALRVVFSDADKTAFDQYLVVLSSAVSYLYLDSIVLDDDDNIGVAAVLAGEIKTYTVSSAGVLADTGTISVSGATGVSAVVTGTDAYAIVYTRLDGATYKICLRTSTDFKTWGSETVLSIGDINTAQPVQHPRIIKQADNTYVLIFSYADYVDDTGSICNIWYSTSTDLSTWADALPITDTTLKSRDYVQPDIVQESDGDLFVSAVESNTYLSMDRTTAGWVASESGSDDLTPRNAWVDEINGKLYAISNAGERFRGVAKIDIATWTIDACYTGYNSPVFPTVFQGGYTTGALNARTCHGAGDLVPILVSGAGVLLFDFATETFRTFMFYDRSSEFGEAAEQNVIWTPAGDEGMSHCWADADNNRLYVFFRAAGVNSHTVQLGYIDLDQAGPSYDFTSLFSLTLPNSTYQDQSVFHLYADDNLFLLTGSDLWGGVIYLVHITTGTIYKKYHVDDYSEFPLMGCYDCVMVGDKLFGLVAHVASPETEAYKYGIIEIDLTSDVMVYHYPSFTSTKLWTAQSWIDVCESTTELIITGQPEPIIFNYTTGAWTYTDYNETGGAPLPVAYNWEHLWYDATNEAFFGMKYNTSILYMLPRAGVLNRAVYSIGDSFTFGTPAPLITGNTVDKPQLAIDSGGSVWAFWNDTGITGEASISWGKTGASLNALQYLTGELVVEWSIDGAPARLTFSLSHGHLFDPSNSSSILNFYLEKGNVAALTFGELVSGVEYWENQGKYVVREIRLKYQRGTYPVAEVTCEDARSLWGMHQIAAVQSTGLNPDDAIADIVTDHTALELTDIDLPTFDGEFEFDAQWLDSYLNDIVSDIAHRFQYFLYMDMDGLLTARKIDSAAAASNTYSDASKIIDYTPDDSFSDLVNRVTVTGQSEDDIEVMYAEERLAGLSGTFGWWGGRKDYTIYYSDDRSKRAKFPRLRVIDSSSSIMFSLAGSVTEYISETDPYHKYCVVTIDAPNLTPILVGAIAGWVSAHYIPDKVASTIAGLTIPWGRVIESTFLLVALNVLGSVASYQYEVWGNPLGYVKRDYSASADDETLQQQIGMVIEERQEGFLCHTQEQCQTVADFEMDLTMLQRKRVSFTKIAHLQDEVGDIISIPHPYTSQSLSVMIAGLKRKYLPENDGHFLDEIEGWRV